MRATGHKNLSYCYLKHGHWFFTTVFFSSGLASFYLLVLSRGIYYGKKKKKKRCPEKLVESYVFYALLIKDAK